MKINLNKKTRPNKEGDHETPERTSTSNENEKGGMEYQYEELLRNGPRSEDMVSGFIISGSFVTFGLKDVYKNMMIVVDREEETPEISLIDENGEIIIERKIKSGFGEQWNSLARKTTSRYFGGLRGM